MEGFDEVINSYNATINTLMVQKARKDDIEMKKREELEEEMNEGFAKKLKITELIKSYMEWELDATLTDLQIIRQQQEFIKKIVEIVGEYSNNEEKVEEANQMLKEADAAIEHIKKEKSDKFHECARYKALLKDALRLVPKIQRKKFINEKIKGIASVGNSDTSMVNTPTSMGDVDNYEVVEDVDNYEVGDISIENKSRSNDIMKNEFDDIKSENPDRICLGCGEDISDRGTKSKYCKDCANKIKIQQTIDGRKKKQQKLKKSASPFESNTNVT